MKFSFPPLVSEPPSRRNWYKELLDDPKCRSDPSRVQEAYETHREGWREKQIGSFLDSNTNPVTLNQALIKHLARQERFRHGHEPSEKDDTDAQNINCCVIWARPPPGILDAIQKVQTELERLIGDDVYLIPREDLHLSVIELSHRHTITQLHSVIDEIGRPRIQNILDMVSTLSNRLELVAPTFSFDKMGVVLNYLPSDAHAYTYHHLRSDMHARALGSGIEIDMSYTAPSAHITLARFVDNKFFETFGARKEFVQLIKYLNGVEDFRCHTWAVGEEQGLELQLGYLKFGRKSNKADMVGKTSGCA